MKSCTSRSSPSLPAYITHLGPFQPQSRAPRWPVPLICSGSGWFLSMGFPPHSKTSQVESVCISLWDEKTLYSIPSLSVLLDTSVPLHLHGLFQLLVDIKFQRENADDGKFEEYHELLIIWIFTQNNVHISQSRAQALFIQCLFNL